MRAHKLSANQVQNNRACGAFKSIGYKQTSNALETTSIMAGKRRKVPKSKAGKAQLKAATGKKRAVAKEVEKEQRKKCPAAAKAELKREQLKAGRKAAKASQEAARKESIGLGGKKVSKALKGRGVNKNNRGAVTR